MDFIVTWDMYFQDNPIKRWQKMKKSGLAKGMRLPFDPEYDSKVVVYPEVNHGRWIVRCPWCPSASFAREDGWFFCSDCGNSGVYRKHVRAPFPKQRKALETALSSRPNPINQNWRRGESVESLRAENVIYGVNDGMDSA